MCSLYEVYLLILLVTGTEHANRAKNAMRKQSGTDNKHKLN